MDLTIYALRFFSSLAGVALRHRFRLGFLTARFDVTPQERADAQIAAQLRHGLSVRLEHLPIACGIRVSRTMATRSSFKSPLLSSWMLP